MSTLPEVGTILPLSLQEEGASITPADPAPAGTPASPPVFSGTRLQDVVLEGQWQQGSSTAVLNRQRRRSGCHGERTGGVNPSPVEGSPADNS